MHPIEVLPNVTIQDRGAVSRCFLERGLHSFQSACHYVKALPYQPNTNNENSLILFAEGHGTCTTKHGAIARLAQELDLPVDKHLGFYRLNDVIVTGMSEILQPYGLSFIPQIHCFLAYANYRVDLTEGNCNGKNQTIEDYDFVVPVQPDLTYQQEESYYLDYLQRYYAFAPELQVLGQNGILELLKACNRQVKYQCSLMANATQNPGHEALSSTV